jgi:hypothetical protein
MWIYFLLGIVVFGLMFLLTIEVDRWQEVDRTLL